MDEQRHVELYKKYRPQTWEQMIGQEKLVRSLKTAVATDKVPTAYLFSGERGCGKTSAAKILAKAINCENPQQGNPCNECETCLSIDSEYQIGIHYESMADGGGADKVRDLVLKARLSAPVKRQVFILDEVHNLSKQAFDAMLIPLEDPNMPALFIFCTTEINRIPKTILSRVQARKFTLVPEDVMSDYIKNVAAQEAIELTDEEVETVVRLGRGSVRDTLTSLEQVNETGEAFGSYGSELLEAIFTLSIGKTLAVIADAISSGDAGGRQLAEQLFSDLRDMLLAISGADKALYPSLPVENPKEEAKKLLGARGVTMILEKVGESLTRMTMGADPRVHLEVALVQSLLKIKSAQQRQTAN